MGSFRLIAFLHRLSAHRWLSSIRNSLVLLLPVTIIGAVAVLIGSVPLSAMFPDMAATASDNITNLASLVGNASYGILALFLLVLVSHSLAQEARRRMTNSLSPLVVVSVAIINFFIFTQISEPVAGQSALGTHSILPALLVAIFSAEVFMLCLRIQHRLFGPQTHDFAPNLNLAVRSVGPALVAVLLFLATITILSLLAFDISAWLGAGVLAINEASGSPLPGLVILGFLNQVLWFVGVHGPHALDNVYRIVLEAPQSVGSTIEITRSFYHLYVHIGGSGATLGLLLAILFYVRQGATRRVAKISLLPGLFNINEPVIYGLPIVLNPLYLIPFVFAPLVQIVVSYGFIRFGLVALDVATVPWMTPPLLAGTLNAGSWSGGALQFINLMLSVLIYLPFVKFVEQRQQTEMFEKIRRVTAEIETLKQQRRNVLDRQDGLAHTARLLLQEFMQDLDSGSGRVYLAYQPQHNCLKSVVGVEALIRWEHRHYGHISPVAICALAEESEQIISVGRWVIKTACKQLHDWKQAGIDKIRMSVNLSPIQLKDESLLAVVNQSLQANRLQASELCFELTESQLIPDDPESTRTLNGLQAIGVALEMDDFGMGYSSMLYVRRFQFNSIKLDGSLTKDILQDSNCSDIIRSVVQLGRALGILVIAEYVETEEQQVELQNLGCDIFQGYLFSPALSGESCFDYLLKHGVATSLIVKDEPENKTEALAG